MGVVQELRARFTATAQGFTNSIREIVRETQDMENEIEDSTENADSGFKNLKNTIMGFAGAYLGFETIKAGVVGAINVTDEYQQALNNLQIKTNATDGDMKGMSETLKNLYVKGAGEDFMDLSNAMSTVSQTTGLTGDALEKATGHAILLRDSMGYDVAESTRTADTMMKQFGITSDQAFTLMAQGQQQGLDKSGDMMDSFNEYSVYFKQLGFDSEGMWNVFKAGSESGSFNIDKVGDSIKELGIRVKDGSKATNDAFAGLGLNADQMAQDFAKGGESSQQALGKVFEGLGKIEDPIKRNQIGVALFGTQFEDLEQETIMALGNVRNQADMTAGTLDKMDKIKYSGLSQAFTGIKRTLIVELLEPMEQQVMPSVNQFIQFIKDNMPTIKNVLTDALGVMGTLFQTIGPIVGNVLLILGSLITTISGPLSTAFGVIMSVMGPFLNAITDIVLKFMEWEGFIPIIAGLGTTLGIILATLKAHALWVGLVSNATRIWMAVQTAFNTVMAMNPIGLVVALLAGLVVAIVVAYQKSETFRNIVNGVWESIKNTFSAVLNWFTVTVPAWISSMVAWFTSLWTQAVAIFNSIKSGIVNIWNQVVGFVVPIVQNFVSAIVDKIITMKNKIMSFISPLIEFFKNTWNNIKLGVLSIIGIFLNLITGNFEGLKISLLGLWTAIKNQILNTITMLKNMAINIFNGLKNGIVNTVTGTKNTAISIFNALKNGVVNTWNSLKNGVVNMAKNIYNGIRNSFTNAKNTAVNTFQSAKTSVIQKFRDMVSGIQSKVTEIKNKITGMKDSVISTIKGINLMQLGKDAIQGFINGIGSKITAVKNKIKEVTDAVTGKIKGILGIHSPSRVLMEIGEWTGEGFGDGIGNMKDYIERATQSLADASVGKLNDQTIDPMNMDLTATGTDGGSGTTYNGPLMNVENQYINNDTDVRDISTGLYSMQRRTDRKRGK